MAFTSADCLTVDVKTLHHSTGVLVLVRNIVTVLSLLVMAELGGKLTSSVKSSRSLIGKTVITEDLPDFRQVDHVTVMEAIVVCLVLVE